MTTLQIVPKDQPVGIQPTHVFSFASIDRIVIHLADLIRVIPLDTIEFVQAYGGYSFIHLTDGTKLMTSKTLKSISGSVGGHFLRTHKSYVVNLKYIKEYRFKDSQITMESNKTIQVSRANKASFREIFKQ